MTQDDSNVDVRGNTDTENETQLREWTVQQFARENKFVTIDEKIHATKENGYLFVSFDDIEGNRTHIYLSGGVRDAIAELDELPLASDVIRDKRIMEVINEEGELRLKLALNGGAKVRLDELFSQW